MHTIPSFSSFSNLFYENGAKLELQSLTFILKGGPYDGSKLEKTMQVAKNDRQQGCYGIKNKN